LYGYNIYKETKSLPVSIGAGIGGFVGFKSPEIVFGSIRLGKGFARQQKFLLSDKKAQQLLTTQKKGEWIYDYVKGKWVRKKSSMSRFEALGEFGRASSGRQIKILKTAFSLGEGGAKKVYLDKISLQKDIFKATKFMKDAGLTKMQIESRLTTLFPSFFKPITISSSGGMVIKDTATKVKNPLAQISESRFTKLSPIISNKLKPITASASSSLIFENQFGRLKTLSQNKVLTKNKQKTLTIQLPAFLSETKQRSGIASISAFNTAMKTRQKEKLVFQPKLVQPSSLFEKPGYRITPEKSGKFDKPKKNIPFIPPFIPFKFPTIGKSKGRGKRSISRKYQYTPSYTAKIFGITGKKTKAIRLPSGREVYTGLSIRKIIGKPKKPKKKSDKKTKKKKVKYKKKKKH